MCIKLCGMRLPPYFAELQRIASSETVSDRLLDAIHLIAATMDGVLMVDIQEKK